MKRDDTRRGDSSRRSRPPPIALQHEQAVQSAARPPKRQSLRLRPSELIDHAEPPSPLKDPSLKSVPTPTTAERMSLFHLFSRPKVERARGHTEKGLEAPVVAKKAANGSLKPSASAPNLGSRVQLGTDVPPTPTIPPTPGAKSMSKISIREPVKPTVRERKTGQFVPPPLFQAYPQAIKEGVLELSMLSAESVLHKSKIKRGKGGHKDLLNGAAEDTASMDTKRSAISQWKQGGHGSTAPGELPRKMFVLVTSGFLLQYAEDGPSDRLPERMLPLGKDSAAFACDLLPGQHYVLQVSQTVDADGVLVINSGNIFSKLGIRSTASKRTTPNLLLVMQSAREMESWMTAIRKAIETMGGTLMRGDSVSRTKTPLSEVVDLKKTPSQSHRYNVQRSPSMAAPVTSPAEIQPPLPTPSPKLEEQRASTATIDGIEMEASKLTEDDPPPKTRTRPPSDVPSLGSSAAVSVDQQQLDNLRSSESNKRFSRASQAPTVATTVSNSRANSLTGSPLSEGIVTNGSDSIRESTSKPNYRVLASYSSKRRSGVTAATGKEPQSLPTMNTSPQRPTLGLMEHDTESPTVGHHAVRSSVVSPPPTAKRISVARSEPNLHSAVNSPGVIANKVPPPPLPGNHEKERPESFVGELPSPSAWSSNRAASRRTSTLQQSASAMTTRTQSPPQQSPGEPALSIPAKTPELARPKRMSTFSIPLKVNPSTPGAPPTSTRNRRRSSAHDPDPPGDKPVVHALTATIEPHRRASVANTTSTNGLQKRSSQRLSIFPTQLPPTPESEPNTPPLASAQQPATQTQPSANTRTLRRPNSMQVSSDRAPFLSSVRNSTQGPPMGTRNFTAPTVPIRGLKPSRSASNVTALAADAQRPSIEALKDLDFGLPPPREDHDRAMPLRPSTSRSQSPLPPAPSSRASSRASMQKGRSALPELDLGIPVVGLGPPAPPPSAPLPAPPTHSRPGSRMSTSRSSSPAVGGSPSRGIDAVAGLGIHGVS